jgi:hypothetical protein
MPRRTRLVAEDDRVVCPATRLLEFDTYLPTP